MTSVLLVRHGPTAWNAEKRIQGRRDCPLSAAGRVRVRAWRLPEGFDGALWVSSPLARAQETARLLGAAAPRSEPRLAEMHWGAWEGLTLEEIRRSEGAEALARNEARGLDFRPRGGESPREVMARLGAWFAENAAVSRPIVAVTHKGVVRAALALATGWDMHADFVPRVRWDCAHRFRVGRDGARLDGFNLALEP